VNLASLDLNLLVALDALVGEAHVGRAARRLGLSQPATSNALRRLRDLLGDPLLVRVGSRMELTPRAEAVREPLAAALDQVRSLLVAERFDPATSSRRFALMMSDHLVDLIFPTLLERIPREAPGIRLDVTPWRGPETMTAELARSIDLVTACTSEGLAGFHRQRLFVDRDALAVRADHPERARLAGLAGFRRARHVAVIPRWHREDPIDEWLRGRGVERSVALFVPSYVQALHIAARTDLVAFVPRRLIEWLAGPLALALVSPPLDPGIDEQFMFHPARAQVDPGSIWLRRLVSEIARGLEASPRTARRELRRPESLSRDRLSRSSRRRSSPS
jgi:DNA-binding transcriptional LysR family regulator